MGKSPLAGGRLRRRSQKSCNCARDIQLQPEPVHAMDPISTPEGIELSVDQTIDRALKHRPDLLKEVDEIRSAVNR
jgi:hypothetical protein